MKNKYSKNLQKLYIKLKRQLINIIVKNNEKKIGRTSNDNYQYP